jgi:hypothetical protein
MMTSLYDDVIACRMNDSACRLHLPRTYWPSGAECGAIVCVRRSVVMGPRHETVRMRGVCEYECVHVSATQVHVFRRWTPVRATRAPPWRARMTTRHCRPRTRACTCLPVLLPASWSTVQCFHSTRSRCRLRPSPRHDRRHHRRHHHHRHRHHHRCARYAW